MESGEMHFAGLVDIDGFMAGGSVSGLIVLLWSDFEETVVNGSRVWERAFGEVSQEIVQWPLSGLPPNRGC